MANAYEAGAAGLPFAVFRGYLGVDLPKVNPNIKHITLPVHRRAAGRRAGDPAGRRRDPRAEGRPRRQRAASRASSACRRRAVLAAKRSLVTVEEIVDDFGERSPNAVILPSWTVGAIACVPGGAHPSYAHGYYKRDNAFYKAWDAISRDRDGFPRLDEGERARAADRMRSPCMRATAAVQRAQRGVDRQVTPKVSYSANGDDDDRGGARAAQQRHLLRRHRHAVGGLQPGAAHPRARHHADLRIRHHRHQARRAAALDRRRRAVRHRAHHRPGAGDVPLLAAGRPLHRRLPRRRADRSLRQSQHHGGRALRQAEDAAARRRRRAGDLQRLRRDFHHHAPGAAQLRREARLRHLVRPRRGRRSPRPAGTQRPRGRPSSSPISRSSSPTPSPRK